MAKRAKAQVDEVIFSPPYGDSQLGNEEHRKEKAARLVRAGLNPGRLLGGRAGNLLLKHYSTSAVNIGNLPMATPKSPLSCSCEIDGVVDFSSTAGFGRFKKYFGEDSVTHPAKANLNLLWFLISKYSSPGETVLDPMAGTFSTGIIAALQGRNGVGVELEDHFLRMGKESIRLSKKDAKGNLTLIKGDARSLTRILSKRFGAAIFSPPYGPAQEGGGIARDGYEGTYGVDRGLRSRVYNPSTAKSPGQIQNLPHGKVEEVIFSPPYGSEKQFQAFEGMRGTRHGEPRDRVKRDYQTSKDSRNVGKTQGQTYLAAMLCVYRECFAVLKPGGKMVLILKDFIKDKKVVPLHEDTMKLCAAVGFRLDQHLLSKLPAQSFWRVLYYRKHPEVPKLEHEHILVFVRP